VQLPRMMLSLCACGLGPEAIAVQFAAIHPDITLPEGIADISPDNAGAILAEAAARR